MKKFKLTAAYKPGGDQPEAITRLVDALKAKQQKLTLLGVTGSGKTFTLANVIAELNRPTLVISHNKTLAAQLYSEFKNFFPENAVEYFISYYDYYQPEAYVPHKDLYIQKDLSINEEIDRLRLLATSSLQERRDVIIVASVSCIYGLGSPRDYQDMICMIKTGEEQAPEEIMKKLIAIQYERNEFEFSRGKFRMRGDVLEIYPAYTQTAIRVEYFGDQVEGIWDIEPVTGRKTAQRERAAIYPAKHFLLPEHRIKKAIEKIRAELKERVEFFEKNNRPVEAYRIKTRTEYDIEMMQEVGYCTGIENYSRFLSDRKSGERPYCLIDYLPGDFLTIIDESHVTLPQIRGMNRGDRARKSNLIDFGWRLPSAYDNRPLSDEEFNSLIGQEIFVSATPGDYEFNNSEQIIEQIIRPTGLTEPDIIIRPIEGQIDDLIERIRGRVEREERVLVTTLTKRMAEDLCNYLGEVGIRVRYLHSDIDALDRVDILRELRLGEFDCLVGINLLREGLDLPEVSLVAILDADKEGFLRSEQALIQTCGRAARNVNGEVVLYADKITDSMRNAIEKITYRRNRQLEYNKEHGITPKTIKKAVSEGLQKVGETVAPYAELVAAARKGHLPPAEIESLSLKLISDMELAANRLDYETAIQLRDQLKALRRLTLRM